MSDASQVKPEEVQAILDLLRQKPGEPPLARDVSPRDFGRPQRLSPARLELLQRQVLEALPEVALDFKALLRRAHALELVEVSEVNAERLFDELAPPFVLLRFQVRGQPAWLSWDMPAAVAAVEVALGQSECRETIARKLSPVEKTMFRRLATALAERIARTVGHAAEDPQVVDRLEYVGSWRDGGEQADARRICLHLAFDGPGGNSTLRVWLPDVVPENLPVEAALFPTVLPEHLGGIALELAARLGSVEVPLAELLSLEPGDVIPLGAPVGEPLRLYVEDRPCATASLGRDEANLAVRILQWMPRSDD